MTLPWRRPSFGPDIQTSITQREGEELMLLANNRKVLEIGAAFGYSTVLMASVATHVLSVDPHLAHMSFEQMSWHLRHYGVEHKVARIVAPSQQVLPLLDDRQFDFIFVDGDHTAEGLTSDIMHVLRLVTSFGKVAFHDWDETTCPEVKPTLQKMIQYGPKYVVDTLAIYGG